MAWRMMYKSLATLTRHRPCFSFSLNYNHNLLFLVSPPAKTYSFFSSPSARPKLLTGVLTATSHIVCSCNGKPFLESFSFSSKSESTTSNNKKLVNTKVNFSLSDSDDDDDNTQNSPAAATREIDKSKLPPPYDPFSKKPAIEEPKDPKDLQEIFHNMKSEGLFNNAVKMFDALSKDGLTHEALQLFAQIKDKGQMPDVVAHTAVIEAYANAGQPKEALKVFMRMLACGVQPNAYTYSVLIKGLAGEPKMHGDAKKYVMEMMGKGMRPNAATYTAVFEGLVREQKEEEARELLQQMKEKGFEVDDEGVVREVVSTKRGHIFRTLINILFGR